MNGILPVMERPVSEGRMGSEREREPVGIVLGSKRASGEVLSKDQNEWDGNSLPIKGDPWNE